MSRMRIIKFIVSLSLGLTMLQACKEESKKVIKTEPIAFEIEGELKLYRAATDSVLVTLDIEIADTDYETQTGLMYRKSMEDDHGMLFSFEEEAMHSFYMKNTEFPLDLIFIKGNRTVASFQENAQPLNEASLSSKAPVQYVLEVKAGLVKEWGLQVGDSMAFIKY